MVPTYSHLLFHLLISALIIQDFQLANAEDQLILGSNRHGVQVTHKVAIIGAGAGGSSCSFFLRELQQQQQNILINGKQQQTLEPIFNITIFESSGRIGGRVMSTEIAGKTVELGASIFVEANSRYILDLSKSLGLKLKEPFITDSPESPVEERMGLWDGREFVYLENGFFHKYVDYLKFLWNYGWDYWKARSLAFGLLEKWEKIYQFRQPWVTVEEAFRRIGADQLFHVSGAEYFRQNGISERFIDEFLGAITRVNYGQNSDDIHAWGALICMIAAVERSSSLKNGNFMLFQHLIEASSNQILLNNGVRSVTQVSNNKNNNDKKNGRIKYAVQFGPDGRVEEFESVVIATPIQLSSLTIPQNVKYPFAQDEYVELHVTVVVTTGINGSYFGVDMAPTSVYTTNQGSDSPFICYNVVEYLATSQHLIVKLFSHSPLSDTFLRRLFVDTVQIKRQVFNAYPRLPPRFSFPPTILDSGLFYVNSFESAISTMETEIISGKNVAQLVFEYFKSPFQQ